MHLLSGLPTKPSESSFHQADFAAAIVRLLSLDTRSREPLYRCLKAPLTFTEPVGRLWLNMSGRPLLADLTMAPCIYTRTHTTVSLELHHERWEPNEKSPATTPQ